jgi:glutamate dehydrogenase (NAD(P)+)
MGGSPQRQGAELMEETFRHADDLGPAKIVHVYEPTVGLKGTLVVDNVATGPAIGGLRMAPDVSTAECFRLARAMTLKNAAAGLPHGGGKSVLYGDSKMPIAAKEKLIRAMACALRSCDDYIFGPDMGTDETCMAWVKAEIGRAVGLPRELGGIPLDEIGATGWGLAHATEVAARFCDFPLEGARVVVQGFGSVGRHAARFLAERGAVLVAAADSGGTIYDPNGLDVQGLGRLKAAGQSVAAYAGGRALDRDAVIDIESDVWIPAARPDVIREENVQRLKTKIVAQGANIPLTDGAEKYLHDHGVLCLPDFIANAGGVICAAMEYHGSTQAAAFQAIEEKVRANTEQVLADMKSRSVLPRTAAVDLATRHVRQAMTYRRWSIF